MAANEDPLAGFFPKKAKPEVLAAELDDLLRNRPTLNEIGLGEDDALAWIGRAFAAISQWENPRHASLVFIEAELHSPNMDKATLGLRKLLTLLNEARHSVRMTLAQSMNVAVAPGAVFDYFDGLRKIVERATAEIYFIDPYLDAEFVTHYLPFVHAGVTVRLLGAQNKWLPTLLPAVDAFAKQATLNISVRSTQHHDRFVFVDGKECYQSGASFKDGGKQPTTLTQILDAFAAMSQVYEDKWKAGKVER